MKFEIGQSVEWESSGTPKTGIVTHILSAGQTPQEAGIKAGGGGKFRAHESYIVRGQPLYRGKYGQADKLGPKSNYWPVVSLLSLR